MLNGVVSFQRTLKTIPIQNTKQDKNVYNQLSEGDTLSKLFLPNPLFPLGEII